MMKFRAFSKAFSLIELLIVVAVLVVILFAILPGLLRPRHASRMNCTTHLKQIGLSVKTFAIDNNDKYPFEVSVTNGGTMELVQNGTVWPHLSVMSNELSTPKILVCPEDKKRTPANSFTAVASPSQNYPLIPFTNDLQVSYFVGFDAKEGTPNIVLAGDRFLGVAGKQLRPGLNTLSSNANFSWVGSWHEGCGSILLSDGSVQQVTSSNLHALFVAGGQVTNRLGVP